MWSRRKGQKHLSTWFKSLFAIYDLDKLVDLDLAWWPFKTMEILEVKFQKNQHEQKYKVLEWGSGASTIWLLRRGFEVTSIEHDEVWGRQVLVKARNLGLNFKLIMCAPERSSHPKRPSNKRGFEHLDFENYVNAVPAKTMFDLIVIDGRSRESCLKVAWSHLKRDGIILFDNSNRKRYRKIIQSKGCEVKLKGITPASLFFTQSSIIRDC